MKGWRSTSVSSFFQRRPSILEISALWMEDPPYPVASPLKIFLRSIWDHRMKAFIGRLMCWLPPETLLPEIGDVLWWRETPITPDELLDMDSSESEYGLLAIIILKLELADFNTTAFQVDEF